MTDDRDGIARGPQVAEGLVRGREVVEQPARAQDAHRIGNQRPEIEGDAGDRYHGGEAAAAEDGPRGGGRAPAGGRRSPTGRDCGRRTRGIRARRRWSDARNMGRVWPRASYGTSGRLWAGVSATVPAHATHRHQGLST